jgi:hypothetical protein
MTEPSQDKLMPTEEPTDDGPCTDCGDTGITYQTERDCSCEAGKQFRPTTDVSTDGLVEQAELIADEYCGAHHDDLSDRDQMRWNIAFRVAKIALQRSNAEKDEALATAMAALGKVNVRCFDNPKSPLKSIGDIGREALRKINKILGDATYDALASKALGDKTDA